VRVRVEVGGAPGGDLLFADVCLSGQHPQGVIQAERGILADPLLRKGETPPRSGEPTEIGQAGRGPGARGRAAEARRGSSQTTLPRN
jgi:hypothetical protein